MFIKFRFKILYFLLYKTLQGIRHILSVARYCGLLSSTSCVTVQSNCWGLSRGGSLTGQEISMFLLCSFTFMTANQNDFSHPEI